MEGPKKSNKGSNIVKLEDIRKRKKKAVQTSKNQVRPQKVDENPILSAEIENDAPLPDPGEDNEPPSNLHLVDETVDTEFIKTPAKRSLVSNRRFNKVKVERIKAELADGSYKINYRRLADKFIEHERFG